MADEAQEKINQLSVLEQNAQQLLNQKQNLQVRLMELESALDELKTSEDVHKVIGNIMVKSNKSKVSKDLEEEKEKISDKVKNLESQEGKLREKAEKLQGEVMKGLEKGG